MSSLSSQTKKHNEGNTARARCCGDRAANPSGLWGARRASSATVLCLIVLALSSCSGVYPPYSGADANQKDKQVWTNMRDVQTAAEHYAANHGGDQYPTKIDDAFKSYLPGGGEDDEKARPVGLINPFFGTNEWPVLANTRDILALRKAPTPNVRPGEIQYSPIDGGKGYAIIGGAHDSKAMRDYDGSVLVFTNFTEEELAEQATKPETGK